MTDQIQSLRDDLDYMKALAREGRQAPILGGVMLLVAGVAFAAASFVQYAALKEWIGIGPDTASLSWLVAMGVFVVALVLTKRRTAGRPGAAAVTNRAVQAVWMGSGWAIFALALAIIAMTVRTHSGLPTFFFAPFILAVYGISWTVAAVMSRKVWIWAVALGCYGGTVVMGLLAPAAEQLLVYGFALLLLAALPGVVLMRGEPSDLV